MTSRVRTILLVALAVILLGVLSPENVAAHPVSHRDAAFVRSVTGPEPPAFAYLGAKHMVTGYDHLMFLVGVIFFLYRLGDVVKYVSFFTIGHSLTLMAGVLWDIRANAAIIDMIIGLSVVYKGFENIGGFQRVFGIRPDPRAAVLIFGLFHGFGLATRLQALGLPSPGLLTNLLSFNIGVEIGQVLALTGVLIAFTFWRSRAGFVRHAFVANTVLMTGGFVLVGHQLAAYLVNR